MVALSAFTLPDGSTLSFDAAMPADEARRIVRFLADHYGSVEVMVVSPQGTVVRQSTVHRKT